MPSRGDESNHERLLRHCRLVPAYAGPSACNYCVPARTGNANNHQNWKKFVAGKHGLDCANEIFSITGLRDHHELEEKTMLHSYESCSQRIVRLREAVGVGYHPNDRPPPPVW